MKGPHVRPLLVGALIGAAAMYFLDPQLGRRHRALARDKARHFAGQAPRMCRRLARRLVGPLRGVVHEAAVRMPWHETSAPPDRDQFIKERVESELGHEKDLPLSALNFDAVDGVVRVRGTVPDTAIAQAILNRVAQVEGVRAVESRMHLPDGTPITLIAGDERAVSGPPRAAVYGEAMRRGLMERWPTLTDDDIQASEGHIGRLVAIIVERTGEPEHEVRRALEAMVEAVV